ncbi:hypothetical protein [Dongshaea marina]|uniref:hypothetical protein n=1 Tax=Dongshaea marina TaxID=2047966 RepID=UPI000D3E4BD1|nr:hypothetical protein [Dongshaea marina]
MPGRLKELPTEELTRVRDKVEAVLRQNAGEWMRVKDVSEIVDIPPERTLQALRDLFNVDTNFEKLVKDGVSLFRYSPSAELWRKVLSTPL